MSSATLFALGLRTLLLYFLFFLLLIDDDKGKQHLLRWKYKTGYESTGFARRQGTTSMKRSRPARKLYFSMEYESTGIALTHKTESTMTLTRAYTQGTIEAKLYLMLRAHLLAGVRTLPFTRYLVETTHVPRV